MYDEDVINFFNEILNNTKVEGKPNKISCESELDSIWSDYNEFVQGLKDEGYKIYRNSEGKHKVVRDAEISK